MITYAPSGAPCLRGTSFLLGNFVQSGSKGIVVAVLFPVKKSETLESRLFALIYSDILNDFKVNWRFGKREERKSGKPSPHQQSYPTNECEGKLAARAFFSWLDWFNTRGIMHLHSRENAWPPILSACRGRLWMARNIKPWMFRDQKDIRDRDGWWLYNLLVPKGEREIWQEKNYPSF